MSVTHASDYLPAVKFLLREDYFRFRVVSNSMNPSLKPGDLAKVEEYSPSKFRAGETLLVLVNGQLICHRLVRWYSDEKNQAWVVTKGDASTSEDSPVPANQLVGRVVRVFNPRIFHQLVWRLKRILGSLRASLRSTHAGEK